MPAQMPAEGQRCVECGSTRVAALSLFGSGEMTMQVRCLDCRTIFEAVKWLDSGTDADDPAGGAA